jgi:hypothetical protein
MAQPNLFYSYTQSYPPSIHPTQLWKYNNCNSFPKVGTSVYTSFKNRKTSCPFPPPPVPILTINSYFNPNQENGIFNMAGAQKVNIVPSGTGLGYGGAAGTVPLFVPPHYGNYAGHVSTNYGMVGFNSQNEPYKSDHYASLSDNQQLGIIKTSSPWPTFVSDDIWNKRGRYIISKPLSSMNIRFGENPNLVSSWSQLKTMTIVWIAGSNDNGGDRPDVGTAVNYQTTIVAPPLPSPPIFNWATVPPLRTREDLFVDFLDEDYNSLGIRNLWKTKPDPTLAQLLQARTLTALNPFGQSVWSLVGSTFTYPDDKFTTTTINASSLNIDLTKVKYFAIRQNYNTAYLDTFGIKYVQLDFNGP